MTSIETVRSDLAQKGVALVTMKGDSMSPLLRDGQSLTVKGIDPQFVQKYDIVLIAGADRLICHYVRYIQESEGKKVFLTKGIANNFLDPVVIPTDVLGVVPMKLPWWLRLKHSVGDLLRNR